MTLKVKIVLFSTFNSKRTERPKIFLWTFWPYLLTTKLSCLQKNKFGHTIADISHIILDSLQLILSRTLIFAQVCAAAITLVMKTVAQ